MFNKEDIEIFVLTSNKKETLAETLKSLLNQSVGEMLITVMDMQSSDGTGELVYQMQQKYPNISYNWFDSTNKFEIFKIVRPHSSSRKKVFSINIGIFAPDFELHIEYEEDFQGIQVLGSGDRCGFRNGQGICPEACFDGVQSGSGGHQCQGPRRN